MGTIRNGGLFFERRRYTFEELIELFPNRVVVLADYHFDHSDLIDGVLIDVCDIKDKDDREVESLKQGYHYLFKYLYREDEDGTGFMDECEYDPETIKLMNMISSITETKEFDKELLDKGE